MAGVLIAKGEVIDFSRAKSYPGRVRQAEKRGKDEARHVNNQRVIRESKRKGANPVGPKTRAGRFIVEHPFKAGGIYVGGMTGVAMGMEHLERRADRKVMTRTTRFSGVGKRLVDEEKHTSIPRLATETVGLGAMAWGGSRIGFLGPSLRTGRKMFVEINPRVSNVLRHAEALRQATERSTTPLGRITGRGIGAMPPSLRLQLDKVPRELRPATATLAGAILVQRATPARRTTYQPVVMD